eukprot:TRINITY_DN32211_c0_g1_i1.p1 TRINITY_DN32211_c0_g1~~TRINITY_DN32211_c0_g1_i1.p1  ORF type:complete len:226 (+),score=45.91 TRINITY_DN32211_c0_g1_i1:107-784(+)
MEGALAIFRDWDSSGDGFIDMKEFEYVFSELGFPRLLVPRLFHAADLNGNRRIEYQEFLKWLESGGRGDDFVSQSWEKAFQHEAADARAGGYGLTKSKKVADTAMSALAKGRWRRLVRGRTRVRVLRLRQEERKQALSLDTNHLLLPSAGATPINEDDRERKVTLIYDSRVATPASTVQTMTPNGAMHLSITRSGILASTLQSLAETDVLSSVVPSTLTETDASS